MKDYFRKNIEVEIGDLGGKLFLDELGRYVGVYYYNQGIKDSIALMDEKLDDIWLLEKRI